ncbi:MAG TPA: 1-acyl-sn-glycerol-3-phosphate acyltransferase [Gammaproteobacteria bacterium]|nr:1-acyl-sn-glycerol-3-phosphate acyltransferase [Gammaproteobacteria bacterium]
MGWIRFLFRFPLVLIYILSGFVLVILLHILTGREWYLGKHGKQMVCLWMKGFARIIGLRVHVQGTPHEGLLAANHVSWTDIIAIDSVIAARFVSKDDILKWPVLGLLPKWSGTFFLRRGSPAAVNRLNAEIVQALQTGSTIAVFPEGTTHDGIEARKFFSAIFQTGIESGCHVQGVAIRYLRDGKLDEVAPFINGVTFGQHVLKILMAPGIDAHLKFCDAFVPVNMDRKVLAARLHKEVDEVLKEGNDM